MGDVLIAIVPVLVLAAVLWALSTALKPRDTGMSEADRYQLDLARRSQAHYAAQVQAATAARARVDAATGPSQNEQQQTQQQDHARAALLAQAGSGPASGHHAYQGAVLPGGQVNAQLALQLQSMARTGQKLQAIRLLRQATHSDLLTAKQYVDRL
jgi:ribosomal protein L7/L12